MKLIILSDLHGSFSRARVILEKVERECPDFIVLLGDLLYHGPRNPLPEGHNPKELAVILNQYKKKIVAVRGNCDAEVDQMVLDFPIMADYAWIVADGRRMYLTHGHLWNSENLPALEAGDIFVSGHTHIPALHTNKNNIMICNPGSCSLPKENHPPSYMIYEDGRFEVRDLNDQVIIEYSFGQ